MKTLLLALLLSATTAFAADVPLSVLRDKEVVSTFATIPVQEAGRLKPLDTLARYRLLRFAGKRTIGFQNPDTNKKEYLSAMEWLLVTWFRPELSQTMPLFVVDNSAAITEIGVSTEGKGKRDRYSYNEILPARQTLMSKMREYQEIDSKKRTAVQSMIANLGVNFLDYEMLITHFDFVRKISEDMKSMPPEIVKAMEGKPSRMTELLPAVMAHVKAHPEAAAPMQNPWMMNVMRAALGAMMSGNQELSMRLFPPPAKDIEPWHGPGWIIMGAVQGKEPTAADLNWLKQYEELYLALPDAAKFKASVTSLANNIRAAAAERGEAKYVNLEESYLRADYFYYALCLFFLGLILLSITWASPAAGWASMLRGGAWVSLSIATVLCTLGIVIRCIIMQRPPITTLYETIIFITATAAIFGLIAEALTRKHYGLLIAAVAGTAGMFLSIRFETMEGQDTMQQLQAVLITNFWLATHVPLINLGYSAAMVSAIISMTYFIKRLFGSIQGGDDSARSLTRMAYGFVGAGLFLSLVGTILGGIWANYSWGRFWGWDPKENGALMIVLMCLIILHARLGGYIREIGLHACNIVTGMITVFSWFGVNQLGVGLHAYGFTDGVWFWLSMFWALQCVFLLIAAWLKLRERRAPGAVAA
ncbi:MAG: cytochrome c biogenesis protein CcsA [Verrucomicrobiaceae bacterium]|nr:cytochrome c biogenesis protein CcsA [Verrucomicrobiaceae bacterium]